LLEKLYEVLQGATRSEYDISSDCKRAAKLIPANLAEGFDKRSSGATFRNHLKICIGSSDEVVAHLKSLSITVPYLKKDFEEN
jgi:four helix bundle protein